MDDSAEIRDELVHVSRLAVTGADADLRLYLSRLARRYRSKNPQLAEDLAASLRERPSTPRPERFAPGTAAAAGPDGSLAVLRTTLPGDHDLEAPVFAHDLETQLRRLLRERNRAADLERHGLRAASSAVFVGPPGVGKTRSARWIAAELGLPLHSLDLTAVMSSRLGQSGANLRSALDRAKSEPSVLFLDEVDAIAKRRDDDGDVGELKRLVTIMLQELDEWPSTSLLLAATNHPSIVDPALWRRFDVRVTFAAPEGRVLNDAITRFLGGDDALAQYTNVFASVFAGESFSEIERSLLTMRKARVLEERDTQSIVADMVAERSRSLSREERVRLASELVGVGRLSQRRASEIVGVSRDTIRKHSKHDARIHAQA